MGLSRPQSWPTVVKVGSSHCFDVCLFEPFPINGRHRAAASPPTHGQRQGGLARRGRQNPRAAHDCVETTIGAVTTGTTWTATLRKKILKHEHRRSGSGGTKSTHDLPGMPRQTNAERRAGAIGVALAAEQRSGRMPCMSTRTSSLCAGGLRERTPEIEARFRRKNGGWGNGRVISAVSTRSSAGIK